MHKKFVEPTRQYATHIIDVSGLSKRQILEKADKIISEFLMLK